MLRIYQSTTASDAKKYYTEALAKQDYYVEGQDIAMNWGGLAAERLGLEGEVSAKAFARLCENLHPGSGERLTPRTRDDRTVGYDLTFHAPKGLSLVHALTGDERILRAMSGAVRETMAEIEANTHTRVRLPGADGKPRSEDRMTGNLAWGEFLHFTSRPVEGVPDPQLHMHCFVFNATFDGVESRWKAGQFRPVVRDHPYFQAAYHTRLAANLEAIGYPISRNPQGWDLEGIPRGLVEKFSRRTQEIEAEAKRLGVTDPAEKGGLGARTRSKKAEGRTPIELGRLWQQRLEASEATWLGGIVLGAGASLRSGNSLATLGDRGGHVARQRHIGDVRSPETESGLGRQQARQQDEARISAERALQHAIDHVFERKSVESDRRLAAEALKHAVGRVSPEQVWRAIEEHPQLLSRTEGGERFMTTREVLKEETSMLDFALEGRGMCVPLGAGIGGRPGERFEIGSAARQRGIELNDDQKSAVGHIVSSRDRVILLRGGAGTGKTELLKEAAVAIRRGGTEIHAFAVTGEAVTGTLKDAGFDNARTLRSLLVDTRRHEQLRGQAIWIDEAGMVGTPTMQRVFEIAEKHDARVILSGDTKQHAPVERGDAMRLLERRAGIKPAEVEKIVRQSGIYRDAVEAMDRGDLSRSVELLDRMGAIKETRDFDDPEKRHRLLAERYLELTKGRKTALVVSPTHAECKQVTELIRGRLREDGRIEKEDRGFTRLQDTQWTGAEKADPHRYEVGQVVQYTQNVRGVPERDLPPILPGHRARIISTDPKTNLVLTEDKAGHRRPLDLKQTDRFGVYREEALPLTVGDRIRFTRECRTKDDKHRLTNGSHYKIAGFTDEGHIVLDNKSRWVVDRNVGHANHAYCITPQAAQGKSVDHCLAAMGAGSMTASTMEQMYVVLSRGKKGVELHTDKRSALIDAMARAGKARSATELTEGIDRTRQLSRIAHAREVQRLRAFERTRQRMRWERQQSWQRQQSPQRDRQQSRQQDLGRLGRAGQRLNRPSSPPPPGSGERGRERGRGPDRRIDRGGRER
ncbi:MAG: MobF family relaxase [Planctomycetota bacterium]